MDLQRNLILISFIFVSYIIWQTWQNDHYSTQLQPKSNKINTETFVPNQNFPFKTKGKLISVKTDVLSLRINTYGGDIIKAQLLSYPEILNTQHPFKLLQTTPTFISQAQSGLLVLNNSSRKIEKSPLYHVKNDTYIMKKSQDTLQIPLYWKDNNGLIYTKIFSFKRNQYSIDVKYYITNTSLYPMQVSIFGRLKQSTSSMPPPTTNDKKNSYLNSENHRCVAYSTMYHKFKKYKFSKINNNNNLKISTFNGWIAMLQHYFVTAWIPHSNGINRFYTKSDTPGIVSVGYESTPIKIYPGETKNLSATLWIGPKIQDKMAIAAPYLDLTVDYGWLWFISQPLFKLLKAIQNKIGNWGFSIILITLIVRTIMYPLTKAQFTSVVKMRSLQPKIQEIRDRVGNNKQRMSQEIMNLYKSEKVNPLGGCFSLIIQMPIFLALYYMLINAVELRHAPFILWINDLSAKDPYYVLPIIMGITMLIIQKMSPSSATITDPMQHKIMAYMPIIFTLFFLWFPSGLVLYYIVSNLVTIIQQQLIYHNLKKQGLYK
ncbi:MAG: membrane protein insertase YidC [Candidatus Dasytiphilus stammeri]